VREVLYYLSKISKINKFRRVLVFFVFSFSVINPH